MQSTFLQTPTTDARPAVRSIFWRNNEYLSDYVQIVLWTDFPSSVKDNNEQFSFDSGWNQFSNRFSHLLVKESPRCETNESPDILMK